MAVEPFDVDLQLLPADGGDITADQELQGILGYVIPDELDDTVQPLGRGWAFDFSKGEFLRHGRTPLGVEGLDHLRVWIEKTLRTARFAHAIYSGQYGTDAPDIIGGQLRPELVSAYEQATRDALLAHDRISDVGGFAYSRDRDDDALFVSFTVTTDEGEDLGVDRIRIV